MYFVYPFAMCYFVPIVSKHSCIDVVFIYTPIS